LKTTIAENQKKVTVLRNQILNAKSEERKGHYEEDIISLESRIADMKSSVRSRTTVLEKTEAESASISTKITTMAGTVSKLEYETEKIEQEAKNTEVTISSETTEKVNKAIKMRREARLKKIKESLKSRVTKLTKIVEEKEKKIETNTKKIVEQTKKIS